MIDMHKGQREKLQYCALTHLQNVVQLLQNIPFNCSEPVLVKLRVAKLCFGMSQSTSRAAFRSMAHALAVATEFHRVGTEQLIFFDLMSACLHASSRSLESVGE